MFVKKEISDDFFEKLCIDYYDKILKYLYLALGNEASAKDCTQEVFLIACQKSILLSQHPNPGGFLFQTAKNLACKSRRQAFSKMMKEVSCDENESTEIADVSTEIEKMLDSLTDETKYIELVLSNLSDEKRNLYNLYYVNKTPMSQIAAMLCIKEPALRMRYVRLRREIHEIVLEISKKYFSV